MFDLEAAIADWKSELSNGPACAGPDAEELESHLRDSVARLISLGLTPEESFLIALHRLGHPAPLQVEYAKAHPERIWRDRTVWMLAGLVAMPILSSLTSIVGTVGVFVAAYAGARKYILGGAAVTSQMLGLIVEITAAVALFRRAESGQFRFRPVVLVATLVVAMLISPLVAMLQPYFLAKMMPPSTMLEFLKSTALPQFYYHVLLSILLPLGCLLVAMRLYRKAPPENC